MARAAEVHLALIVQALASVLEVFLQSDQKNKYSPDGIRAFNPAVARHELPWDTHATTTPTLKGLYPSPAQVIAAGPEEASLSGLIPACLGHPG